jgi:hypothetical protein
VKLWILIFSAALFAGGTCLGVALHPRLVPPTPIASASTPSYRELSVTRFASELGLSDEQDRELDRILAETHEETQALGRALGAAHQRGRERVTALLGDEQRRKLDALIADERGKRSDDEAQRKISAYVKLLDLAPSEAEAFRKISAEYRQKRRDAFAGGRKHGGDWEAARASYRRLREEQNAAVQKTLKPEQFVKYLELAELERHDR